MKRQPDMKSEPRTRGKRRDSARQADLIAARQELIQKLCGKYRGKGLLKALAEERKRESDF